MSGIAAIVVVVVVVGCIRRLWRRRLRGTHRTLFIRPVRAPPYQHPKTITPTSSHAHRGTSKPKLMGLGHCVISQLPECARTWPRYSGVWMARPCIGICAEGVAWTESDSFRLWVVFVSSKISECEERGESSIGIPSLCQHFHLLSEASKPAQEE